MTTNKLTVVIVEGGVCQVVFDYNNGIIREANYDVIDLDCLESGTCPFCQEDLEVNDNADLICPSCGLNWDDAPSWSDLAAMAGMDVLSMEAP